MNESGSSRKQKDWSGHEYTEHRDGSGKVVGESRKYTDVFGSEYTEHRDSSGKVVGESREYTDVFGSEYTEHRDSSGKAVGESREYTDVFGSEYTEHRDADGNTLGVSRTGKDWQGKDITRHSSDTKGHGAGLFSGGGGGGEVAGEAGGAGAAAGVVITLLLSVLLCFLSRNDDIVIFTTRKFVGICLCPLMMVILSLGAKREKTDSPAVKGYRRTLILISSLLFLALQIIFLFYTDPEAEGGPELAFVLFLLAWAPKLIYSILVGALARRACAASGGDAARLADISSDIHVRTGIGYAVATGVMEMLNAFAGEMYKEIIGAVIYGAATILTLVLVIRLLLWLTDLPFRAFTKNL